MEIPELKEGSDVVKKCIPLSEKEIISKLEKLDGIFRENRNFEYETSSGEKALLGNNYTWQKKESGMGRQVNFTERYRLKNYPLEEKLRAFYQEEIGDYGTFIEWEARFLLQNRELYQKSRTFYEAVFGKLPFAPMPLGLEYQKQITSVRLNYRYEFMDRKLLFEAGIQAVQALTKVIHQKNKTISYHYTGWNNRILEQSTSVNNLRFFDRFLEGLGYWKTEEEFKKAFYTAWKFELKCSEDREQSQFIPNVQSYNSLNASALTPITPYWFLKAYHMELISKDILLKSILNYFNRRNNLKALTQLVKGNMQSLQTGLCGGSFSVRTWHKV